MATACCIEGAGPPVFELFDDIRHLIRALRGLPRPVLQGFTKAFRKRFQIPEDAPTIAGAITRRCHHEWIEAWLVSHQALLA